MSFTTMIWNFTEYLAYLCIIIQTGLAIFGPKETPQGKNTNTDGIKDLISRIGQVADKFVEGNVARANKLE